MAKSLVLVSLILVATHWSYAQDGSSPEGETWTNPNCTIVNGTVNGNISIKRTENTTPVPSNATRSRGCEDGTENKYFDISWNTELLRFWFRVEDGKTFELFQILYYKDGEGEWFAWVYGFKGIVDGVLWCKEPNRYHLTKHKGTATQNESIDVIFSNFSIEVYQSASSRPQTESYCRFAPDLALTWVLVGSGVVATAVLLAAAAVALRVFH